MSMVGCNLWIWLLTITIKLIIAEEIEHNFVFDSNERSTRSPLLLLLVDGLRSDIAVNFSTTDDFAFGRLRKMGTYKSHVKPVFPAECHPNMYSLFTGVHPLEHGVLFSTPLNLNTSQTKVKTLWESAATENKKVHIYHLPVCSKSSTAAWLCEPYDSNQMYPDQLNRTIITALEELINGSTDIAIVYYDELDRIGHKYGPLSNLLINHTWPKLNEVLNHMLDYVIKYIPNLNVIITSDHGMTDFKGFEYLDRFFKGSEVDRIVNRGSTVWIWPQQKNSDSMIYHKLLLQQSVSNFRVYNKTSLPSNWLIGGNDLAPILLVAEPGFLFYSSYWPHTSISNFPHDLSKLSGVHGYDPEFIDMHFPLFAFGPTVARNVTANSTLSSIVEIHDLILSLAGLSSPSQLIKSHWAGNSKYFSLSRLSFITSIYLSYFIGGFACVIILQLVIVLSYYYCRSRYHACDSEGDVLNEKLVDRAQMTNDAFNDKILI